MCSARSARTGPIVLSIAVSRLWPKPRARMGWTRIVTVLSIARTLWIAAASPRAPVSRRTHRAQRTASVARANAARRDDVVNKKWSLSVAVSAWVLCALVPCFTNHVTLASRCLGSPPMDAWALGVGERPFWRTRAYDFNVTTERTLHAKLGNTCTRIRSREGS
jgi:hypothetical protein